MTSDGVLEELSGHSYQLKIEIFGTVNEEGFIVDFRSLKPALKEIIRQYNHKTIVPTKSSYLHVVTQDQQVKVTYRKEHFSFPQGHCLLIERENVSTEILADCLLRDLLRLIPKRDRSNWKRCRMTIAESPGQSAFFEVDFNV